MKSNNILNIYFSILLFIMTLNNYFEQVNSYLIFPLEYLPDKNYRFSKDNKIKPEETIQQIYYKNLITKFEIGSPLQKINLLFVTNSDKFYLSNFNISQKEDKYYQFIESDFYNESLSSTNIDTTCEKYNYYPYNIVCQSKDIINFKLNNTNTKKEFQFKLQKNNGEYVPGYIGLLFNDSYYEYTKGFITELKAAKLIDNYYWFFDINEFSPLEKKLKGKFVIGGLPHELFPKKYSLYDFESTSSYESKIIIGRAWRLNVNKIYIDKEQDKNINYLNKVITFQYEIYHIISNFEFLFDIESLLMDDLIKEGKCFSSSFSQHLYNNNNLSFFYCNKTAKETLYEKLPNLKFSCVELDYVFELTAEELFYEKGDYIYFNILFNKYESNTPWIMGQIFTSKYNFVFNSDYRQIGFYKKVNKDIDIDNISKTKISMVLVILFVLISAGLVFTIFGLLLGKKIFERRKIRVNELADEADYDYKSKEENFESENNIENQNDSYNQKNVIGINNN